MLNLLAISYENIGPFKDQKILLHFEKGNFLIKAPIGTGKSFLFFDGPTYALYKSSTRNILNVQSKTGNIKLLFEVDGQCYLIIRQLKQGKSKDSTTSQFFRCEESATELQEKLKKGKLISYGEDLATEIINHNIQLEELTFKNESDLQQQLNQLLPSQEVFISTIFLLQDAENIFEMQPANRLEVLKNVFGLLGIDESKEIVREKRNELKYQIKAYQDHSRYEEKLKTLLKNLISTFSQLQKLTIIVPFLSKEPELISELEMMQGKLSIQNFAFEAELGSFLGKFRSGFEGYIAKLQKKKAERWLLSEQLQKLQTQLGNSKNEILKNEQRIQQLEKSLAEIKADELPKLKGEKAKLTVAQMQCEEKSFSPLLSTFYQQQQNRFQLQVRTNFSLLSNAAFVQELLQLGIQQKQQKELLEQKKATLKQQQANQELQLQSQIKSLEEQESFFQQQEAQLQEQLQHFDKQTENDAQFNCSELGKPCPFVQLINQQHFEQRAQQKELLLTEIKKLQTKKTENQLLEQKNTLLHQLDELKKGGNLAAQEAIFQEEAKITENINILKQFLQSFPYKELEQASQQREQLRLELAKIEQALQAQEALLENKDRFQEEKIWLLSTNEHLKIQLSSFETEIQTLKIKDQNLAEELQQLTQEERNQAESLCSNYEKSLQQGNSLIEERNELQLKSKQLVEEEKLLGNLYTILNKELLLFVLSEYLPILSEIINSYLSSVVDYSISIQLKESSEKLELETKIIDEKGEREVKSLSGGQRTILKLVRMLAISSYMKTEMLFLDETVNNLDAETVGKVAQLLTWFVKQRQMKFYTITHNSEIQAMSIWNEVLELGKK